MSSKNKKLASILLLVLVLGTIVPLDFASADVFTEIREYVLLFPLRILLSAVFIVLAITFTILLLITTPFVAAAGTLLNWVVGPNFTNLSYTNPSTNPIISAGLNITLPFANMFFILILVVIAIATILRVQSYAMQKLLPTFIIIALLVNFAPVICGLVVDFSNLIMNYFITNVAGWKPAEITLSNVGDMWKGLGGIWDFTEYGSICPDGPNKGHPCSNDTDCGGGYKCAITGKVPWSDQANAVLKSFAGPLALGFFQIFYNLILMLVMAMFIGLFFMRRIMIWLLVIIAPVCLACYILPVTKGAFKWWWEQLFQWAIIGIVGGFFLFLGAYFMSISSSLIKPVDLSAVATFQQPGENWLQAIVNAILPTIVPLTFLIVGFFLSIKTSALGAGAITSWAKGVYDRYLSAESLGRATRKWAREKAESITPGKIAETIKHPIQATKAGLKNLPGVDMLKAMRDAGKEWNQKEIKRLKDGLALPDNKSSKDITDEDIRELAKMRGVNEDQIRSEVEQLAKLEKGTFSTKKFLSTASDQDLKSLSGALYKYGLSKVPILNRSELADYFKKYGEYGYAINTLQGEAKPYSSITLAEDIINGNVSGVKAVAWLREIATRGDMQDFINIYKKKYGYANDEDLFKDQKFRQQMSGFLTLAYKGGEGNKIIRMDPRLGRIMAGKGFGFGQDEREAIERAVTKVKTSDLKDIAKEAFYDEDVVRAFAKLKGEEFWREISRNVPEAIEPIMKNLEKIYQEDAKEDKEMFKEAFKGFSMAMDQYEGRMRASNWRYPWETKEEAQRGEEKPTLIKAVGLKPRTKEEQRRMEDYRRGLEEKKGETKKKPPEPSGEGSKASDSQKDKKGGPPEPSAGR